MYNNKQMTSLDRKKAYQQKYYQMNKEKLLEQAKIYYQLNADTILLNNKNYRDTHITELSNKAKLYHIKNKEERQLKNIIIKCECGSSIKKQTLTKHLATKKHNDLLIKLKCI